MATLREHLCTPYAVTVTAVQDGPGNWIRRAECPELPGFHADAPSPWDAMALLDQALPRFVIENAKQGRPLPRPRPALRALDAEAFLADLGLSAWIEYLDCEAAELAGQQEGPPLGIADERATTM